MKLIRGFTIFEILLAVSVMIIVAGIGYISWWGNIRARARDAQRITDVNAIKMSLEVFYEKNNRYPFDSTNPSKQLFFSTETQPWIPEIVTQGYSLELPKDPKQAAANPLTRLAANILEALEIKPVSAVHEYVPPAGTRVKSGSYNGNGQNNRPVTGVGFQPDLVIIKAHWDVRAVIRSVTMANSYQMVGADPPSSNRIKSFTGDGFTLGTSGSVNQNGIVYYYLAIGGSGSSNFNTFTYPGNGVDNRSIAGCGFQPDMVMVVPESTWGAVWRTSTMTGDNSQGFEWSLQPDTIQALESTGFQIGLDASVNTPGITYHAICFQETSNIFDVLTYTGNGLDNRSIAGTGFMPEGILIKSSCIEVGAMRLKDMDGDTSAALSGNTPGPNGIQALEPNGFQIGTDKTVNDPSCNFHAASWHDNSVFEPQFYYLYHVFPDKKTYNVWATLENKKDPGIYDHVTAQCKSIPPITGYNYCGGGF
jgi:type II secretory pathway pseudopilin PulG